MTVDPEAREALARLLLSIVFSNGDRPYPWDALQEEFREDWRVKADIFLAAGLAPVPPTAVVVQTEGPESLIEWVCGRWAAEVANRPLVNIHRRTLDDTWRQILRHLGADDVALLGPTHDDLAALTSKKNSS